MVAEEEIPRFAELGLGRGVDSTNVSPWINKSAFQVRNPTVQNLIGTDEGGLLQSYKSSISGVVDIQEELKASVSTPNTPVSLGVEGELSRSCHASRKAVGRKVINRIISFRVGQEDSDKSLPKCMVTFEEFLSQWILNRINTREEKLADSKIEEDAGFTLNTYLSSASKKDTALVVDDCSNFIRLYGVTHYVTSISLGASEHTVVTESLYSQMVKEGFDISISDTKFKSSKTVLKIELLGRIVDEKVERGSENEAVVEIKLLPINSLIRPNSHLHHTMQEALINYIEKKSIKPSK